MVKLCFYLYVTLHSPLTFRIDCQLEDSQQIWNIGTWYIIYICTYNMEQYRNT